MSNSQKHCRLSAEIISVSKNRANSIAMAVLPEAVGPATMITVLFRDRAIYFLFKKPRRPVANGAIYKFGFGISYPKLLRFLHLWLLHSNQDHPFPQPPLLPDQIHLRLVRDHISLQHRQIFPPT